MHNQPEHSSPKQPTIYPKDELFAVNRQLKAALPARVAAMLRRDKELAASQPIADVTSANQERAQHSIEVLANLCKAYGPRPAFGEIARTSGQKGSATTLSPSTRHFTTLSYSELWQRTQDTAKGLRELGVRPGDFVGIYGFGSIDYAVADFACLYLGATSIALQTGMRASDLQRIAGETAFGSIFVSFEYLEEVTKVLTELPPARQVILMDYHGEDPVQNAVHLAVQERLKQNCTPLELKTIGALAAAGARASAPLPPYLASVPRDQLVTLMYTSGSTGSPKGAMLPESLWIQYWRHQFFEGLPAVPYITVGYQPLNHIMGRIGIIRSLSQGGTLYFTEKSDMSTLFPDIRLVRPTALEFVPRVTELIHQQLQTELIRRGGQDARAAVMAEMGQSFLGDRLLLTTTGSAPSAPEVVKFIQDCFQVPLLEAYGSTEAGVITVDEVIVRSAVSDYKLIDVPELGYSIADKPFPRGEILVKTSRVCAGYYKNAEATQALIDTQGYLHTGDIAEERAPDHLAWIDRKNNILKLSQGEFVTIWRLEAAYEAGSTLIKQIYIYGNSQRAYLLAVIVPDAVAIKAKLGHEPTPTEVKQWLRGELNQVAQKEQLQPYEIPRDFLVEPTPFTRENGLLTGVAKPARPQLRQKYGASLEALYQETSHQQLQDLAAVSSISAEAPTRDKVIKAVAAVLGSKEDELTTTASFKDLGGDSLNAVALASLLQQVCQVEVPVSVILSASRTLAGLIAYVEEAADGGQPDLSRELFTAVHGEQPTEVFARDLTLDRFLTPSELSSAQTMSRLALPATPKTVLLTGANGFLGRFLCLDWLQRLQPGHGSSAIPGGKVICIIRAADDTAAAARLKEVYSGPAAAASGDQGALAAQFERLTADGTLMVVAGDLAAPRLGLSEARYTQLAQEVDLIVHAGALVNHVLPYQELFAPNVVGTVQLIKLALTHRPKRFDYVSTVGVLSGLGNIEVAGEDQDIRQLRASSKLDAGYAAGYGLSKWAGEVLLRDMHDRFAVPVHIYRCDMILAHNEWRGQINAPDMFSRLLISLVKTGLAPASFYCGPKPARSSDDAHYDGLPVDFIAQALGSIAMDGSQGLATYNVSNPHADGISLDTIAGWVESAGYPLKRVANYGDWVEQLRAALTALPEKERQLTSLPLLHQLQAPAPRREPMRIDASRFRAQVQAHGIGVAKDIPHLSAGYVHKMLSDLRSLGLIKGV